MISAGIFFSIESEKFSITDSLFESMNKTFSLNSVIFPFASKNFFRLLIGRFFFNGVIKKKRRYLFSIQALKIYSRTECVLPKPVGISSKKRPFAKLFSQYVFMTLYIMCFPYEDQNIFDDYSISLNVGNSA